MSGWFLAVDKPENLTSFDVVAVLRRVSGERRVGHTGTLDPFATGLLLLLGGPATKLCPYLLDEEKEYEGVMLLGTRTDTGDPTGRVLQSRPAPDGLTRSDLQSAASKFIGRIRQTPPAYSAVKVAGERLYSRARRGLDVSAPEREVDVHAFEIRSFEPPRAAFTIRCGRGTYVRTLAEDLGFALGCGASLASLRRTRIGRFRVEEALTVEELGRMDPDALASRTRPSAEALAGWTSVTLPEESVPRVRRGVPPEERASETASAGRVRLLDTEGRLVAIAESAVDGRLRLLRVL